MTRTQLDELIKLLDVCIEEYLKDDEPKHSLAHYTSLTALKSILETKQIWLSSPLLMNDTHEVTRFLDTASEFLLALMRTDPNNDVLLKEFIGAAHKHISEFKDKKILDSFIFCLSEWDDDEGKLSMWRAYANSGSGVAIVFNPQKVLRDESDITPPGKAIYRNPDRIIYSVREITRVTQEFITQELISFDKKFIKIAADVWFHYIKLVAFFTKHDGFKEELEWRMAHIPETYDTEKKEKIPISYKISGSGIDPVLKVPFESLEECIEKIVLAPTANSNTAEAALKAMLRESNFPSLADKVTASKIPFRNVRN